MTQSRPTSHTVALLEKAISVVAEDIDVKLSALYALQDLCLTSGGRANHIGKAMIQFLANSGMK